MSKIKVLKQTVASLVVEAQQSKLYFTDLWEAVKTICTAQRCANTVETALGEKPDFRALTAPAMYYQNSTFGLQLVIKYAGGEVGFVHLMHDKDGDPIVDENDTYTVKDVRAKRSFDLDGETIIEAGDELTKAYAVS